MSSSLNIITSMREMFRRALLEIHVSVSLIENFAPTGNRDLGEAVDGAWAALDNASVAFFGMTSSELYEKEDTAKEPAQEAAQGLVEYALILVLVAIVVIAVLTVLGPTIGNVFSNIVEVL